MLQQEGSQREGSARLWIKVIEARSLLARSPFSRPYCVVEFEKNEFVTREATAVAVAAGGSILPSTYQSLPRNSPRSTDYGFQVPSINGDTSSGTAGNIGLHPVWRHEAAFDVSRASGEMTITIWDRAGGQEESFLGCMRIQPPRVHGKLFDNWFKWVIIGCCSRWTYLTHQS